MTEQAVQTEVIKMINYSRCGIGQTGYTNVQQYCLAQLKGLFMRFGKNFFFFFFFLGGGGGGGGW